MPLEFTTLEIQILLKCYSCTISKSDVTQIFKKYSPEERAQAIEHLISQHLILDQEMPKLGAKKVPVFYEITENGKNWVKNYLAHYPK